MLTNLLRPHHSQTSQSIRGFRNRRLRSPVNRHKLLVTTGHKSAVIHFCMLCAYFPATVGRSQCAGGMNDVEVAQVSRVMAVRSHRAVLNNNREMKSGHCLFPRRGITLSSHGWNPWYAAQIIRFFGPEGVAPSGPKGWWGRFPLGFTQGYPSYSSSGNFRKLKKLVKSDAPLTDKTTADSSGRCDPIPAELSRMGIR
jgi:hypothetical protein